MALHRTLSVASHRNPPGNIEPCPALILPPTVPQLVDKSRTGAKPGKVRPAPPRPAPPRPRASQAGPIARFVGPVTL